MGKGFLAIDCPTARDASALPAASASARYELVEPGAMARAAAYTFR
jgi:hypothetical protein